MKRYALVFSTLVLASFTACSKAVTAPSTYVLKNSPWGSTLTLKSDGSFELFVYDPKGKEEHMISSWTRKNGMVEFNEFLYVANLSRFGWEKIAVHVSMARAKIDGDYLVFSDELPYVYKLSDNAAGTKEN